MGIRTANPLSHQKLNNPFLKVPAKNQVLKIVGTTYNWRESDEKALKESDRSKNLLLRNE